LKLICFVFFFVCRLVDNHSPASSTDSPSPPLINTSPIIKKLSLSRVESLNSISGEKVSLMSATEQSSVVQPLLTDLYQISMAYAYWKSNKHHEIAIFDLYFRKNRK